MARSRKSRHVHKTMYFDIKRGRQTFANHMELLCRMCFQESQPARTWANLRYSFGQSRTDGHGPFFIHFRFRGRESMVQKHILAGRRIIYTSCTPAWCTRISVQLPQSSTCASRASSSKVRQPPTPRATAYDTPQDLSVGKRREGKTQEHLATPLDPTGARHRRS